MTPDRPQAPGYLANLMARLFHEVSAIGLAPLGIAAEQFPVLIQLWFGDGASRQSLVGALEMGADDVDALVRSMVAAGLVAAFPDDPSTQLELTAKAQSARDAAVTAARAANQAAAAALSEDEMAQLMAMMNRVIDALQAAKP